MNDPLVRITPEILTAYARWSIAARDVLEASREEHQARISLAALDISSADQAADAWDDLDYLHSQAVDAAVFVHRMERELTEAVASAQQLPDGVDGEDIRVDIERQLMGW